MVSQDSVHMSLGYGTLEYSESSGGIPLLHETKKGLTHILQTGLENVMAASIGHREQIAKAKSQHENAVWRGAIAEGFLIMQT